MYVLFDKSFKSDRLKEFTLKSEAIENSTIHSCVVIKKIENDYGFRFNFVQIKFEFERRTIINKNEFSKVKLKNPLNGQLFETSTTKDKRL